MDFGTKTVHGKSASPLTIVPTAANHLAITSFTPIKTAQRLSRPWGQFLLHKTLSTISLNTFPFLNAAEAISLQANQLFFHRNVCDLYRTEIQIEELGIFISYHI